MTDCIFIIIGATGDLAKRMLLPAIYKLFAEGKIDNFALVGAALSDSSPAELFERSRPYLHDVDETLLQRLIARTVYQQLDITHFVGFQALKKTVELTEQTWKLGGNRVIYCATASSFFVP